MSNTNINPNMNVDKPNQFPWKLYDMLHTAEQRNEEHIISWIRDGKAFKVHNRSLFIEEYMKKMFNQTKFKSFQRQLNLWGFERVQDGPDKGSYFHLLFVKGRRDCCQRLTRVRLKGTGEKTAHQIANDSSEQSYSGTAPAARIGNVPTSTSSSLLGAFIDAPASTNNTTGEASLRGASRQQQFSDLINYHTSQRRREMIRNAAIGLRPDLSLAVVGAPLFATASELSNNVGNYVGNNSSQRDRAVFQQQQQYQHQHQHHHVDAETHPQEQHIRQQQMYEYIQLEQQSQSQLPSQDTIQSQRQSEEPRRRQLGNGGLDALLSVSAQRRREEELALLLGLSDPGGMSQNR